MHSEVLQETFNHELWCEHSLKNNNHSKYYADSGDGGKLLRAFNGRSKTQTMQRPNPRQNNEELGLQRRLLNHDLHGKESATYSQIFSPLCGSFV